MFRATDGTKREYTQDVVAAAVSYIKVCLGLQEHEKRSIRNAAVWIYLIQPHILNSHHAISGEMRWMRRRTPQRVCTRF